MAKNKVIGVKYISLEAEITPIMEDILRSFDYYQASTAFLKMHQQIGLVEDHVLYPRHIPVIAYKAKVEEQLVNDLIAKIIKLEPDYFDYDLWSQFGVLRRNNVIELYTSVYKKNDRAVLPLTKEQLISKLIGLNTVLEKEIVTEKVNEKEIVTEKVNEKEIVTEKVNEKEIVSSKGNSNSKGSEGSHVGPGRVT